MAGNGKQQVNVKQVEMLCCMLWVAFMQSQSTLAAALQRSFNELSGTQQDRMHFTATIYHKDSPVLIAQEKRPLASSASLHARQEVIVTTPGTQICCRQMTFAACRQMSLPESCHCH